MMIVRPQRGPEVAMSTAMAKKKSRASRWHASHNGDGRAHRPRPARFSIQGYDMPLELLEDSPWNPVSDGRTEPDNPKILALAESMKEYGLVDYVVIREREKGLYR